LICFVFCSHPRVGPEKINVLLRQGCMGPKLFPRIQLEDDPHHPNLL